MQKELIQASLAELQQKLLLAYEEAHSKDRKDSSVAIELLQAYGAALAVEYFPKLGVTRSASLSEIATAIKKAAPDLRTKNPNTWDFLARITERIGKHYGNQGKQSPPKPPDKENLDAFLIPFSTPQKPARTEAIRDRELHSVPSDVAYQLLREAIAFNRFTKSDSSPWPTAHLSARNAIGSARLIPLAAENSLLPAEEENKWVAVMWEQQAELSDLENDVLDALCTIWLHHARSENDDVLIDVDDLLKIRGLKAKPGGSGFRGGYSQGQRNEMLRAVSRVANLWIDVARRQYKKTSREEIIQSRAIVITDRKGQLRTDGYLDVESFIYRPGRIFSRYLLGPGRQTALLSSYALHYNPRTQPYEKRLVRYLSWQWRVRSATGIYCDPYSVQKLLDVSGIKIHPRKPAEAYERFERALDTLQENGVIASWQFVNWHESALDKRGWVSQWTATLVAIEPPDTIKNHYGGLIKAGRVKAAPDPQSLTQALGERIRTQRSLQKLSQFMAAEQIGISQPLLSKLENGYQVNLSKPMRKKIEDWLNSNEQSKSGSGS